MEAQPTTSTARSPHGRAPGAAVQSALHCSGLDTGGAQPRAQENGLSLEGLCSTPFPQLPQPPADAADADWRLRQEQEATARCVFGCL